MPRKDKTGPLGEGPMTGRGLGVCKNVLEKDIKKKDTEEVLNKCGYGIRELKLNKKIEKISATKIRNKIKDEK